MQFATSPVWRTPIHDFTDENCGVFSADEEEMSLEYTIIHKKFVDLIDKLLTDFVNEIGISTDDVLATVRTSLQNEDRPDAAAMQRFMKYIFAMEDFETFYHVMVKRNIELDVQAARALNMSGIAVEMPNETGGRSVTATQQARLDIEEAELRAAIAASLQEQNSLDLEDAELREALALSVQTEKDRARHESEQAIKEVRTVMATELPAAEAEAKLNEKLVAIEEQKEINIQKLSKQTLEAREENVLQHLTAKSVELAHDDTSSAKSMLPPPKKAGPAPAARTTVVPAKTPALSALPPVRHSGGFGTAKALPNISQPPLSAIKCNVEKKLPLLSAQRISSPALAPPTMQELEARARYMREQREKILAVNKASRRCELNDYIEKKGHAPSTTAVTSSDKQLTIDIARRLREDIVGESRK